MYETLEALAGHYAEPSPSPEPNTREAYSRHAVRQALAERGGAATITELVQATGYTYPTVREALRALGVVPVRGRTGPENHSTHGVMLAVYKARDSYTNHATITELVEATGYTYPTVSKALKRLAADGLLVPARWRTEALGYTGYGQAIPTEAIGRRQLEYALSDAGVAKARGTP